MASPMLPPLRYVTFEERHRIRDIYIPLVAAEAQHGYVIDQTDFASAYAFTGDTEARGIFDGKDMDLMQWLMNLYEKSEKSLVMKEDFRLEHDQTFFRAKRVHTHHGWKLAIRRIPSEVPRLTELRLPFGWHQIFLDPELLTHGGLILNASVNGAGKTTTISAIVRSRLEKFAGIANCVEDPPELPLSGWFGKGVCNQIPVEDEPGAAAGTGYLAALRDSLRFFPSLNLGGSILMVGEIRDPDVAAETLLAAANGHLVLATFHGASVAQGLQRLTSMASQRMGPENARAQAASVVRACVNQKLMTRQETKEAKDVATWDLCDVRGEMLYIPPKLDGAVIEDITKGDWSKVAKRAQNQTQALQKHAASSSGLSAMKVDLVKALTDA